MTDKGAAGLIVMICFDKKWENDKMTAIRGPDDHFSVIALIGEKKKWWICVFWRGDSDEGAEAQQARESQKSWKFPVQFGKGIRRAFFGSCDDYLYEVLGFCQKTGTNASIVSKSPWPRLQLFEGGLRTQSSGKNWKTEKTYNKDTIFCDYELRTMVKWMAFFQLMIYWKIHLLHSGTLRGWMDGTGGEKVNAMSKFTEDILEKRGNLMWLSEKWWELLWYYHRDRALGSSEGMRGMGTY